MHIRGECLLIRAEVIRKRLNKLDEYFNILKQMQHYSYDEFIENPERYGSTERFLQLLIETITDIGNHIIAELNLGVVNWYSDIPTLLFDNGYIDESIKEIWIKMIGFRNVLIHDYLDIDHHIVYNMLTNRLEEFQNIKKVFTQFL
jgi:uncharacterized protein YutE (UPF0331/DUF86 family)